MVYPVSVRAVILTTFPFVCLVNRSNMATSLPDLTWSPDEFMQCRFDNHSSNTYILTIKQTQSPHNRRPGLDDKDGVLVALVSDVP